ncbi:ATP-binding protein [Streptomyces sp. NPDC052115]|uniref:HD domain-containing protein n=1 Tax=Streptomyces sp. NPDC052115 TaxID=3155794 RepID=UPI0034231D79
MDQLAGQFRREANSWPWQPRDWTIDPLKLSCILRLADATQVDGRRAPTLLFALRNPQGVPREHWRFQTHVSRPDLTGDRVTYTALRPFLAQDAPSWWLALDYLRGIDQELKAVDALLHDLGRDRFAARAVAGVDSPERFAEHFRVQGWRPIDATVTVSDVSALVRGLGGEQLYGDEPEVAVRELIQNAQDAVLARHALQPDFPDGRIDVLLTEADGSWCLEVRDNGVGMDEETLIHGLLDFGKSGWSSPSLRNRLPGLAGGGFKPSGRFGIGFFSVFLLGDKVELTTRRYDAAVKDARRLSFDGTSRRPLLTPISSEGWVPEGTTVRVFLKKSPNDIQGVLYRTEDDRLSQLIQRLVLENAIPIQTREPAAPEGNVLEPFSLATGSPEAVFDRLYPPALGNLRLGDEKQRLLMRDDFIARATELLDDEGRRIGLATLWGNSDIIGRNRYAGIVTLSGFFADGSRNFVGYLCGQPNRASRDRVALSATQEQVRKWLRAQELYLRDTSQFDEGLQLELAGSLHQAFKALPEDMAFALTSQGPMCLSRIAEWAAQRDRIFLASGAPLSWHSSPPRAYHIFSLESVELPDDWVLICERWAGPPLSDVFPYGGNRDAEYEFARNHATVTWEKGWWRISSTLTGSFMRMLCTTWSCTLESLLHPIAQRDWSDELQLGDGGLSSVSGYLLVRPPTSTTA